METLEKLEHKDYMITQVSSQEVKGAAGGTIPFTAPEVLKGGTPTKESDMYSFGMFLIELLYRRRSNPWAEDCKPQCILSNLTDKKRPSLPKGDIGLPDEMSERFLQVIKGCWNEEPSQRPPIVGLIKELEAIESYFGLQLSEKSNHTQNEETVSGGMLIFDLSAQNKERDCDVFTVNQMNLNMHQGSVVETCGDITVGFVEAGAKIPGELDADMEMERNMYDGSNACTFLSVAIASWLEENTEKLVLPRQLEDVRCVVEKTILDIPKAINSVRNMSSHFSVEEAVSLLGEVGKCNVVTETLMNSFAGINTPNGENSLFEGLTQLHHRRPIFAVYTSPPISLCISCFTCSEEPSEVVDFVLVDTHRIPEAVGGNGNGTILHVQYSSVDFTKAAFTITQWIKQRLLCCNTGHEAQSVTAIKKVFRVTRLTRKWL